MTIRHLFILLFCISFGLSAQMIDEMSLSDFKVAFNDSYLKNNNIKSITGHTSYKKELKPIVEKNTFNRFTFDRNGKLNELVETFKVSTHNTDSSITSFKYAKKIINEKTTVNSTGEHQYKYTLNSNNKIEKLEYLRGGIGEEKTIVFEEFYTYELKNDTTEIKWYLNRYGKPYQKETSTHNQYGYLLSIEKKLVFGGSSTKTEYHYDQNGRLNELLEHKNKTTYKTIYIYDEYSNLIEKDFYNGEILERHEEFIYDSKTSLIKALLSKDMKTNTIFITKYTVEFFN